jgi:acetyl-CoA C-acetyltransferase
MTIARLRHYVNGARWDNDSPRATYDIQRPIFKSGNLYRMWTVDPRAPCVIGVARQTWHPDGGLGPEPLDMWERVARAAATDAGSHRDPLAVVNDVSVVHCQSWNYDDPARRLADRLRLATVRCEVSMLAGTSPQRLVNAAAERMLRGESELALIVGGEALATRARLRRGGEAPRWSWPDPAPPDFPIDAAEWVLPTEAAHGVLPAWLTFALLDEARRVARGAGVPEYRAEIGGLLARCSKVASSNPDAWFRTEHTVAEITTPGPANRMVASPYTKFMTAFMDVDMAAGLLLATHQEADRLGVAPEKRVYLRGWAFALDAKHLAARGDLHGSGAMRVASAEALRQAGCDADDISSFDLYSCFSAALGFALDALGVETKDCSRSLTRTGGLPYHGGPSSNYLSHSIGYMVEHLRESPGLMGMTSGVGMHMTKHVFACYSSEPGVLAPPDYGRLQADVERQQPDRVVAASATGQAWIASATTVFDHQSNPTSVVAVCDLPDGRRAYARSDHPDTIDAFTGGQWAPRVVELRPGPEQTNLLVCRD